MKKNLFLFCSFIFLFELFSIANADTFDISPFKDNELFNIDVEIDEEIALIESVLPAESLTFIHENESPAQYSSTRFDVLVIDYFSADSYPIWRLWLNILTKDTFYYITSVSITIDEEEFTFSGIADKDWFYAKDNSYLQRMLVKFGYENLEFLVALENFVNRHVSYDDVMDTSIPIVFHGTDDISAELGPGFLLEFLAFKRALVSSNGVDYLDKVDATTMKVKK